MRTALMIVALAALAGCGGTTADNGPERQSAAGEVLGGEASDEMLPLDTVRSTSPAGRSGPAAEPGSTAETPASAAAATPTARPTLEAAPMPDMTMPADPEPLRPEDE